jgi:hypothetical protein
LTAASVVTAAEASAASMGVPTGQPGTVVYIGGDDPWGSIRAIPLDARSGVDAVANGPYTGLALKAGRIIEWGSKVPALPADLPNSSVGAVAASHESFFALRQGVVYGWGVNDAGKLDIPAAAKSGVSAIAAGLGSMAVLKNGGVITWGQDSATPPASAQSGIRAVAVADQVGLALNTSGRVIAWGNPANPVFTVPAAAQSGVSAIAANGSRLAISLKDGGVLAWGDASDSVLNVPTAAKANVKAIALSGDYALALKLDGSVVAWGNGAPAIPPVVRNATAISTTVFAGMGGQSLAVVPTPTNTVRVKQAGSGKCMTATDASWWVGADVTLQPCSDELWDRQQFQKSNVDTYYTRIQSWYDQGYLDSANGWADSGTHVVLGPLLTASKTQKWLDRSSNPSESGAIIHDSGLVIDTDYSHTDDGTPLVIGQMFATPTQSWHNSQ